MRAASPRPIRLLFVDHASVMGGAQLALVSHIANLDRSRFHPIVACTDSVPALVDRYRRAGADVRVVDIPRLRRLAPGVPLLLFVTAWRLRRLVRETNADIVVANTARAAYAVTVALLGTSVSLVWWVRDVLFGRLVFRALHRRADRLIAVSAAIRKFYGGEDDPRFAVVHVGSSMHEEVGRIDDAAVAAERERWGFSAGDVVVGFMGRLVEDKGPEDLVEAVRLAHAADPRVKLLIVGSGDGQTGDVEERLHRLVQEEALDFVVFAGFQSAEALYYRLFDQFVLSSRAAEAYATSVVQAMMAGTPVIATATGGTAELVRDAVTGILVPAAAPRRMADAILRLARDPALSRHLAATAQAEVLQHNRESVTTARVERVYDEVLAERCR